MTKHNSSPAVVEALTALLADNYTLYVKTQHFHWNVTGPQFQSLHLLFQAQYEDLAEANDDIAERIRALGSAAPGRFSVFQKLATVQEAPEKADWKEMVKTLADDQDKICSTANKVLKLAQETGDEPTIDMMIGRLATHQKNQWMLKAHLE